MTISKFWMGSFLLLVAGLAGCGNAPSATVSTADTVPGDSQFIAAAAPGTPGAAGAAGATTNTANVSATLLSAMIGNYTGEFFDDVTYAKQPLRFTVEMRTNAANGQRYLYYKLHSPTVFSSRLGEVTREGALAIAATNGSTQISLVSVSIPSFFGFETRSVGLNLVLNLTAYSAQAYSLNAALNLKDCSVQSSTQCYGNHGDVSVVYFDKVK